MHFVDDVDFVFAEGGGEVGVFTQGTDMVDAGVAGGVDFDDVEVVALDFVGEIVDGVGEDAGDGGFAGAAGADEEVGVGDLAAMKRFFECGDDVWLADDFG